MCVSGHYTTFNLGMSSDTLTLTSCSTLISTQSLLFTATNPQNPDLQKCAIIKRKAVWSNIETVKELELVLLPYLMDVLPQNFKIALQAQWVCCGALGDPGTQGEDCSTEKRPRESSAGVTEGGCVFYNPDKESKWDNTKGHSDC